MAIKLQFWLVISLAALFQLACNSHYNQAGAAYETGPPASTADRSRHQSSKQNYYPTGAQTNYYTNGSSNANAGNQKHAAHQKCARQSIILARQMLAHELDHLNLFNSFWFSDLDKDELIEGQKHSLSNIVMSGASTSLLNSHGQPLIEIESSYFRHPQQQPSAHQTGHGAPQGSTVLRLLRKHQDKCHLNLERGQFSYTVGLSIGPIEHHLDVIYNLPKELRLSQPIDWRYGQIMINVPKMHYEVVFKQTASYKLDSSHQQWGAQSGGPGCPLEVSDVTYLAATSSNSYPQYQPHQQQQQQQQRGKHPAQGQGISITSSGLALNNQTQLQIERLFDDYTRPTVSHRLRQMLKFYLNSKTFPLAAAATTAATTAS